MKALLLERLACPRCSAPLAPRATTAEGDEIVAGVLHCRGCPAAFPILAGIPRFVSAENYAGSFGFQWNHFRQTQLDSHSGTTISRDRFLKQSGWSPGVLAGARVLDAGCGAGRFAEVALALGAEVTAVDYSTAVEACRLNLGSAARLHVVQADLMALPFRDGSFDCVYSFGVLQHTPDPRQAVLALARQLRPGGTLAVDVYPRHWHSPLNPKYVLRSVTTRLDHEMLFRLVRRAVPPLLALSRSVARVPLAGPLLRRAVPVANYEGIYPLTPQQLREWAVLDTFDMLSPAYDQPQTSDTLERWLREAELDRIETFRIGHLVGRARRPDLTTMPSAASHVPAAGREEDAAGD